jgi:S-adenosylmethionine:tRNA ribosyltransferase-isomerase
MNVSDFDFDLPASRIAQAPLTERGTSKLLVLRRHEGARVEHASVARLPEFLRAGDLLIVNDTKVFPARLLGKRVPSGGAVECLLLSSLEAGLQPPASEPLPPPGTRWDALVHPGQSLRPGSRVIFAGQTHVLHGEIVAEHFHGRRTIRLWTDDGTRVEDAIDALGHVPLPPYIKRKDDDRDRDRYQTVYARERGSIAAPTAGLHFTPEILDALDARGVERAAITLHVGYGTFQPVRVDRVEDHALDRERFTISESAAETINRAKQQGRRVIAVGTTTTRALEGASQDGPGVIAAQSGWTGLFIYPGYEFRIVDGLMTNFHLPKSSLLMLACALGGREAVLAAYREAMAQEYRFYSYGDAMLIV